MYIYIYIYIYIKVHCITPLAWVEIQCFALTVYMPTCLHVDKRAALHAYTLECVHACSHQKTSQNPPKILQKTIKNLPKSGQEGLQNHSSWILAAGRPQDASKTLQDIPKNAFWTHPGSLRGVLGRKSGQEGPKLAPQNGAKIRLEASWGRLGGILGASWERLGPSWDRLGTIFEACHLGSHVLIDFSLFFHRKSNSQICKNHEIILQK